MKNQPWEQADFIRATKPPFVTRFAAFLGTLQRNDEPEKPLQALAGLFYDTVFSQATKDDGVAAPSHQALLDGFAERQIAPEQILSPALLLLAQECAQFMLQHMDAGTPLDAVAGQFKAHIALLEQRLVKTAQVDERQRQQQQKKEQQDIIARLRQSHDQDKPLTLVNTFRGISVSYDAKLKSWDENHVTLEIHKYQTVAIAIEKCTLITGPLLVQPVWATVHGVDPQNRSVTLANFTYLRRPLVNRERLRLQPDTPTRAVFSADKREFLGTLVDISSHGVGIFIDDAQPPTVGAEVQLRLTLAALPRMGDREITLSGKVVNRLQDRTGWRLGLLTYPDFEVEEIISKYLAHMQMKILHDLQWRSAIG